MQSRLQSLIESCTDIGFGFALSMLVGMATYPRYTQPFSAQDIFEITCIFTAVGLARRYCTRRFFNWWHSTGQRMFWNTKLGNRLDVFLAWNRHYRTGHVLVYRLGRWESFCRALVEMRGKR